MYNLGYGEYGGGILRGAPTPRIEGLAAQGAPLLNFKVEAQCTPSPAVLVTGRYAIRTGNSSVPIEAPRHELVRWECAVTQMLSDIGPILTHDEATSSRPMSRLARPTPNSVWTDSWASGLAPGRTDATP
jgi:hypothetical protein